jgi:hypothetical protein
VTALTRLTSKWLFLGKKKPQHRWMLGPPGDWLKILLAHTVLLVDHTLDAV